MQHKRESNKNNNNQKFTPIPPAPVIILCRPQMGENIGAAARAMLNFQLTDLRIVSPRDGWPNERATATASGALDLMSPVKIFDTLQDAISDLNFTLATTARHRDMVKPVYNPANAMQEISTRINDNQKTGIIFGAERTGLTNGELSLCQAIMSFPTNPQFASINLAQSVLLAAYEWHKCYYTILSSFDDKSVQTPRRLHAHARDHTNSYDSKAPPTLDMNDSESAPQGEINGFIERLESDLESRRFFRTPEMKPTMMVNIRNIFTRSDISLQELRTLHGILSALRGNKTRDE
ncbi:MAG: RNA methyltransferase [Alphaproteobacteria bacterium]|nr:RNA methyltransferase [Alphaproteobacteria bacterium]